MGTHILLAEFSDSLAGKPDLILNLSRQTWLQILFGEESLKNATESEKAIIIKGSTSEIEVFINLFDKFKI